MDPTIFFSTWPGSVRLGETESNSVIGYDMALDTAINTPPTAHTNAHSPFQLAGSRRGIAFQNQLRTGFWEDIGAAIDNILSYIDPVLSNWQVSTNANKANNPDFLTQYEVFQAVNPSSIGTWGSLTSGDLLVVTMESGAFIVNGDFFQPTVTMMPGVQPTHGEIGVPAITPLGLVYASGDSGVWVWDGGAVAQKISTALTDNFFKATVGPSTPPNPQYAQGAFFNCLSDGDYLYCSNNWLYSQSLGSWWQILSTANNPYMWYVSVPDNVSPNIGTGVGAKRTHYVFAAPATFKDTAVNVGAFFDKNVPAKLWQWESNPFLLDDGYIWDLKEFWIQLSGPHDAYFQIYINDASNGNNLFTSPEIFPDPGTPSGPKWYRFPTPATAQSISILVQANAQSSLTPLIPMMMYGFDIIYNARYPVRVAGSS